MTENIGLSAALNLMKQDSTEWTEEEQKIAIKVMKKFANCAKQKARIPQAVFEANLEGNKSVNSDVAVILWPRRIYLPRRGPSESFAGKLHLPGATHRYETLEEATGRLLDTELKMFGFKHEDLEWLTLLDLQDLPRAPAQSNLYAVRSFGDVPKDLLKDFYRADEIPWDQVVESHRTVTLPWLIDEGCL